MANSDDPRFIDALQRVFMTRNEMRELIQYQQKLFSSLQELSTNHRQVHEHVRRLTESHNRVQDEAGELVRTRDEAIRSFRTLDSSHRQTQADIRQAISAINAMQSEIRKITRMEDRLRMLEKQIQALQQEEKRDDRKDDEQDRRLKQLEHRKHLL